MEILSFSLPSLALPLVVTVLLGGCVLSLVALVLGDARRLAKQARPETASTAPRADLRAVPRSILQLAETPLRGRHAATLPCAPLQKAS